MSSIADFITGKSSRYTKSQPHRNVCFKKPKFCMGYTYCQSESCEICASFEKDQYVKRTYGDVGIWCKNG